MLENTRPDNKPPFEIAPLSRRRFLQMTGGALAVYAATPMWMRLGKAGAAGNPIGNKKLVVLCLSGGNDGLNTVVPYGIGDYYAARPTIAYRAEEVHKLSDSTIVGLHPSLVNVAKLYEERKVAIVQGTGYDKFDLSHFSAMDIWQSGSPTHQFSTGWLGRYLDVAERGGILPAVAIGNSLPMALVGAEQSGVAVPSFAGFTFYDGSDKDHASEPYRLHETFLRCGKAPFEGLPAKTLLASQGQTVTAVRAVNALGEANPQPPATLADQMATAVTILNSDLGCEVAFLTIGGFDDHASTKTTHPKQLTAVDDAVARFFEETAKTGKGDDYLLMTFSEFGRRVQEDGSAGTDHGTAAPMFVMGGAVAGGIYGEHPGLAPTRLDDNRNLKRTTEFREVYATLLDRWMGVDSAEVLGTKPSDGLHPIEFLK